jgi:cysteinyl-tRNA synthetase
MPDLHLHNTLTGKKEIFKPLKPGHVSMYVCGITPYDESHIGHARCYVVFDLLKRVLALAGYQVNHIQNFTDVDDKIINRAHELKQPAVGFAEPYMQSFKKYMEQLNVVAPNEYPLVTENIKEIKELIQRLIDKGVAYELNGDVYYSVRKFSAYGKLSKRKIDELAQGARVEVNEQKHDPLDFALWKKAKEGEPFWESSWGKGRPGWHIECSAMSMKFLGEKFDIHGGGLDLVFPHHENEIAQSQGATGDLKSFAQYWVHNGFVTINKEKMSKSLGNFFTIKEVFGKYDPMVVRYFLLAQHYRSPLNFSDQELDAVKTVWENRISNVNRMLFDVVKFIPKQKVDEESEHWEIFAQALFDDLNTPKALAELNNVCSKIFQLSAASPLDQEIAKLARVFENMLNVLGLSPKLDEFFSDDIRKLALERWEARINKNWKRSDELRDLLKEKGVIVEDTAKSYKLKRI